MNANRLLAIVFFTPVILPITGSSAAAQENQADGAPRPIERFLIDNQLPRLLLTYRETRVGDATVNQNQRLQQLYRQYAEELFKPIADEAWSEQLLARAKMSLAAHPHFFPRQRRLLRLAVAHREVEMLQLQYLKEQKLSDVGRITSALALMGRGLKQHVENLERLAELRQTAIGDNIDLKSLRQQRAHCEYLQGWSYFLQSVNNRHLDKQTLRDAESYFRSFLELDPYLNLTKFSADKFGKATRYQRSATLGLSLVMQAIKADAQAKHCFAIAQKQARSSPHRQRETQAIVRWKFLGWLNLRDFSAAKQMRDDDPNLLGDMVLTNAILRCNDVADELAALAMIELALAFRADQLRDIFTSHPGVLADRAGVEAWIDGYRAWDDWQRNDSRPKLQLAIQTLQNALQDLDESACLAVRGHCRFLLGSCRFEQNRFEEASALFFAASQLLSRDDRALAAEAAYRAFQSVRLQPGDQYLYAEKIAVRLTENFPQSELGPLAIFHLKVDQLENATHQDAIEYLQRCRTDESPDSVRSAATVELAKRYRLSDDTDIQSFRALRIAAIEDDRVNADAKIDVNYYFLSALLDQSVTSLFADEIEGLLTDLESPLSDSQRLKNERSRAARQLYYRVHALQRLRPEDYSQAFTHFRQLKKLGDRSPWTLATIIEVAKFFEGKTELQFLADDLFRAQMIEVYRSLHETTKTVSEAEFNREVAAVKLAELYLADGQFDAAHVLAEGVPENLAWLPILASLAKEKNDPRKSESYWQRLERQLPVGSEQWWEARLNRMTVLRLFDTSQSIKLLSTTTKLNLKTPRRFELRLQTLTDQWRAE